MELRFKKEQIKILLENYYREKEDFNGAITTECSLGSVGYGMSEKEGAVVEIKLTGSLNVLGTEVPMERYLTKKEVEGAFNEILYDAGYEMGNFSYDSGVHTSWEGYGMSEHRVTKPYFNGIVASVKTKSLVK